MKIYRVVDDGTTVLVTGDELKALRRFKKVMEKHEETANYGWVDTEVVE